MDQNIQVRLNGEDRRVPASMSVRSLLESLDIEPRIVAVERNREILSRACFDEVIVQEGDSLEVVHFVGGG